MYITAVWARTFLGVVLRPDRRMSLFLKDEPSRPRYAIEQNLSEVMMGSWGLVLKGTDGWLG